MPLLTVALIVGNQQDILQKLAYPRDALHKHRHAVASGYPHHTALDFGSRSLAGPVNSQVLNPCDHRSVFS